MNHAASLRTGAPTRLSLSNLIKCGVCGAASPRSATSIRLLGCAQSGTCDNRITIRRDMIRGERPLRAPRPI